MSEYLPTGAVAHSKFDHAKRQAFLEGVTALLRGQSDDLLPFDDIQKQLTLHITRERGLQQIPLDKIVGSVGKYRDFTRSFWPKSEKLRERWKWIYVAAHSFRGLPPVELYQVGEVYFVKDGNHRISVARELGNKTIEAYVTEYITPVPVTVDTVERDLGELVLQLERQRFLQRTRLLELRPAAQVEVSQAGDYARLQEHMAIPAYVLSQEEGRQVSWEETVGIWHDDVYAPVVQMIHEHDLPSRYPGRTDADLYLWLMEDRDQVAEGVVPEQALAAAARKFVETIGSQRLRWVLETRSAPGLWRERRVLPRGEDRLFADILLTLDETPSAWQMLDHVLPIAARETGRLHGLFVGQTPADYARTGALLARFAEYCDQGDVAWKFHTEIGPSDNKGSPYANTGGYDLVVLRQGSEQVQWHRELLGTQMQGVIRQVACPVLVLSEQKPRLSRALLAYDGSPCAEEALYVAAYLTESWEIPLVVVTVEEPSRTSPATLEVALSFLKQRGITARTFFKGAEPGAAGVAQTILQMTDQQGCDLIILGDSAYSPFVELFVHSTVDHVLREAGCSVLVCS